MGVLIADGRIVDVFPWGRSVPGVEEVVDARAATVLPGLVDVHVHPCMNPAPDAGAVPEPMGIQAIRGVHNMRAMLMGGITTIRTLGTAWGARLQPARRHRARMDPGPAHGRGRSRHLDDGRTRPRLQHRGERTGPGPQGGAHLPPQRRRRHQAVRDGGRADPVRHPRHSPARPRRAGGGGARGAQARHPARRPCGRTARGERCAGGGHRQHRARLLPRQRRRHRAAGAQGCVSRPHHHGLRPHRQRVRARHLRGGGHQRRVCARVQHRRVPKRRRRRSEDCDGERCGHAAERPWPCLARG